MKSWALPYTRYSASSMLIIIILLRLTEWITEVEKKICAKYCSVERSRRERAGKWASDQERGNAGKNKQTFVWLKESVALAERHHVMAKPPPSPPPFPNIQWISRGDGIIVVVPSPNPISRIMDWALSSESGFFIDVNEATLLSLSKVFLRPDCPSCHSLSPHLWRYFMLLLPFLWLWVFFVLVFVYLPFATPAFC